MPEDLSAPLSTHDECGEIPWASIYYGRAGDGGSASVLLGFCDEVKRATKLRGNPQNDIILVNELVVARLAELLGAPCPEGKIVRVDEVIVEAARQEIQSLSTAQAGLCFGSTWVEGAYSPGEAVCQEARNRADIARLIVLYTWTRNTDVKDTHLLSRSREEGGSEVFGLDHGHCFDYDWRGSIGDKRASVNLPALPQALTLATQIADFPPALERLSTMSREEIEHTTLGVPQEWGANAQDLAALVEYLDESRPAVGAAVMAKFGEAVQ